MKVTRTAGLIISCLYMLCSVLNFAMAQSPVEEERLFKAAFIYNFTKFTSWPDNTWQEAKSPLALCIIGNDELINDIKRLEGKLIKGRQLAIRNLNDTKHVQNCQVLYIAHSENKHQSQILQSVKTRPILTISELENFAQAGGMIQLQRKKGQTQLTINLNVARKAGLELSSRLLILAKIIDSEASQ